MCRSWICSTGRSGSCPSRCSWLWCAASSIGEVCVRTAIICIVWLVGAWVQAKAEPLVEGRVRLPSGTPVPGAQVLLFDLTDLRAPPVATTTDRSGHFALPLASLSGALPQQFELGANYPNPFNPSTMIPYRLPAAMHVRLEVYNLLGQRVATLANGEQPAGFHTASWDATDAAGEAVGAGVYLYRLSGDGMQADPVDAADRRTGGDSFGWESGGAGSREDEAGGADGEAARVYGLDRLGPGTGPLRRPGLPGRGGPCPRWILWSKPRAASRPPRPPPRAGYLGDVDNTGECRFLRRPAGGPVQPGRPPSSCPTTATSPWGTSTPTARSI